jgi:hypothetical protein
VGLSARAGNLSSDISTFNPSGNTNVIISDMNFETRTTLEGDYVNEYYAFVLSSVVQLLSYDPKILFFKIQYPLQIFARLIDDVRFHYPEMRTNFVTLGASPATSLEIFFIFSTDARMPVITPNEYFSHLIAAGLYDKDAPRQFGCENGDMAGRCVLYTAPVQHAKRALGIASTTCSLVSAGFTSTKPTDPATIFKAKGIMTRHRLSAFARSGNPHYHTTATGIAREVSGLFSDTQSSVRILNPERTFQYVVHEKNFRLVRAFFDRMPAIIVGAGDLPEICYNSGPLSIFDTRQLVMPAGANITFNQRDVTLVDLLALAGIEGHGLIAMNSVYMNSRYNSNQVRESILAILGLMNSGDPSVSYFCFSVYRGTEAAKAHPYNQAFGSSALDRFTYGKYDMAPYLTDFQLDEGMNFRNLVVVPIPVNVYNVPGALNAFGSSPSGATACAIPQISSVLGAYMVVKA